MNRSLALLVFLALVLCGLSDIRPILADASPAPAHFHNPVIPGFHPDPSIVRVDEDYYLVNSSFEWFPGIPVFHSRDLVNWRQLGHVLNRRSQLNMVANKPSSGVWAPTIRHHLGRFYVIVTCKQCGTDEGPNPGWNFFVTAERPEGPWSDPVFVDSPRGIDPSLFFDDDGTAWFSANRFPEEPRYPGEHIVYTQRIDLDSGRLLGERFDITSGMAEGTRATEGPHQYRVDDRYYLVTAEDMTWEKHAVAAYVADRPQGPYSPVPGNPLLSHRDKPLSPVQNTGHADLVQTQKGDWWSVMLGVRKLDGHYNLGRETFLAPVAWRGGMPEIGGQESELVMMGRRPDLPWTPWLQPPALDEFEAGELRPEWNMLRTPQSRWWSLSDRPGVLRLALRPERSTEWSNPSLVARRFQHHQFIAATGLEFEPEATGEEAGLIAMQNDRFQYRLVIEFNDGNKNVSLYKVFNQDRKVLTETLVHRQPWQDERVLALKVDGMALQFMAGENRGSLQPVADAQDGTVLASNVSGGFSGAYVGMYASSNGGQSDNHADFDWFLYQPGLGPQPAPYGNPVVRHMYTADASPHVFPDGRVWMVTSVDHEQGGGYETMHRYHSFSTTDMVNWTDHGSILEIDAVRPENPGPDRYALWAPDMIYRDGRYYLYYPVRILHTDKQKPDGGRVVTSYLGVAVSDAPDRPFTVVNPRIEGTRGIDPAVFIDDDGEAYLYWGQHLAAKLADNMIELASEPLRTEADTDRFMEAPWMHKRDGRYFLSYHSRYDWQARVTLENHDDPERLKSELWYSVGDSPMGPFRFGGRLNPELGVGVSSGPRHPLADMVPWKLTQSNHGGIVEYHGQEYLFYHTSALSSWRLHAFQDKGEWTQRSVSVDRIEYDTEGMPRLVQQTVEGVPAVFVEQAFERILSPQSAERGETEGREWLRFEEVALGSGYYYFDAVLDSFDIPPELEVRADAPDGELLGTARVWLQQQEPGSGVAETFLRNANGRRDIFVVNRNGAAFEASRFRFFAGSPASMKNRP